MNSDQLLAHFNRITDAPDAIPRLRGFILNLAIRGKLVEQDSNDESASELLNRIRSEKTRLTKAGEIRRQAPQARIKPDEAPFEVPRSWVLVRLGDVIHLVSGQHLQPNEYSHRKESGPPYITGPADFGVEGLEITRYALVRKAVAVKGQILLTVKGAGVGKTALCNLQEVAISRQLMALTAIAWSQSFLLVVTHRLAETLKESARSLIPGISREDVEEFVFPLPPLAEQHRIVQKIAELMALCDGLESAQQERESRRDRLIAASLHRLNQPSNGDATVFRKHAMFHLEHLARTTTRPEQVKQLRRTILNLAIHGQLVSQNPEDNHASKLLMRIRAEKARLMKIGEIKRPKHLEFKDEILASPANSDCLPFVIPSSWIWVPFGQIVILRDGERIPVSQEDRARRAKTYDYYGASGVIDKIDGYLFDQPLLLIGEDGANLINRSTPIAFIARGKYWVNNHAHVIDGISEGFLRFLELYINSIDLRPYVTGTAQPKMNQAKMNSIPVALPPEAEQIRIVSRVDELMSLCNRLEAQLSTVEAESRRLLEAVLHQALTPSTKETH